MSIVSQERLSDSPLIASVTRGRTVRGGSSLRPATNAWHMVFVKQRGSLRPFIVGPLTTPGVASWEAGADVLWIRFSLGTFLPGLPFKTLVDAEIALPEAARRSFWLNGSAYDAPDFDDAETFVERLVRANLLTHDPLVSAMLERHPTDVPERTVRHRFSRATGLSRTHLHQIERASEAADLLRQGVAIPDVVYLAGYADQPHLTRALKKWVGYTPAQLLRKS